MLRCCLSVVVVLIAIATSLYLRVLQRVEVGKQLTLQDSGCKLLDLPTPVEDLTALGDGHCVFAGGGDLGGAFRHGSVSTVPGSIWLINATAGTARKLRVRGEHVPHMVLHGMFFSFTSRRLYAVNHDEAVGETVEIFEEVASWRDAEWQGHSSEDDHDLVHLATIRSSLFLNLALNDVVEGVDGEFFVTQWLPFGKPVGGMHAPSKSWHDRLISVAGFVYDFLEVRGTRVLRCHPDERPTCQQASEHTFMMANGIAISKDRQQVFVADPLAGTVIAMRREATGMLTKVAEIETLHRVDNLEFSSDGTLHAGVIGLVFATDGACEAGFGRNATLDGRTVGCGSAPGGLVKIHLHLGESAQQRGSWVLDKECTQEQVIMHDGSKLSQVSAAVQVNPRWVVIGSPMSRGALICPTTSE